MNPDTLTEGPSADNANSTALELALSASASELEHGTEQVVAKTS